MNDSEKLELLSILEDIKLIRKSLDSLEKRARSILAGWASTPPVTTPQKPESIIGKSIHDSIGNIPTPSASEIRAHTMEYNERITK